MNDADRPRCRWCFGNETYIRYHDEEWGVPVRDGLRLFELLLLEGVQAGLSWLTVLKKRDAYRKAFDGFDPRIISLYDDSKINELMTDSGIIRNRIKIKAFIQNSKVYIDAFHDAGSFADFLWGFTGGSTIDGKYDDTRSIPALTRQSEDMSRELKKRGFCFVGPVSCYAFMQSAGMVNDHVTSCFRHDEISLISLTQGVS